VGERNVGMEGTVTHTYLLRDELRVPATCDFIGDLADDFIGVFTPPPTRLKGQDTLVASSMVRDLNKEDKAWK